MILVNLGALITLLLGLLAVIRPDVIQRFVSIRAVGKEGRSELKATYGGFFIAIALYALVTQSYTAFTVLAVGWLGAALVRAMTLCQGAFSWRNLGGVLFEAIVGGLCLARQLS